MSKTKLISITRAVSRSPGLWLIAILVFAFSCLDPFDPPELNTESRLVVDGFVDTKTHVATVRLTRTKNLKDGDQTENESAANVEVLSNQGDIFALTEISPGIYQLNDIPLNNGDKCSLHILLADGKEYASDQVELKFSPPIDSLTYATDDDGVKILVTTHDESNSSRLYLWTCVETWEYTAVNFSALKLVNGEFLPRRPSELVYRCWRDGPSPFIRVSNTLRLEEDKLSSFQLTHLAKGSQKISVRYSVNVIQRVVTKEEYNYMTLLLNTTESLGGLFDKQPAAVSGNIHSIAGEPQPIGYFSGGSSHEKRLFVDWLKLPDHLRLPQSRIGCQPDSVPLAIARESIAPSDYVIAEVYKNFSLWGYMRSNEFCSDCRAQGGITTPPDFWQ